MIREETVPANNEPGLDERWVPEDEAERAEMLATLRRSLSVAEKKIDKALRQRLKWNREYWQAQARELQLLRRIRQVEREAVPETEEE